MSPSAHHPKHSTNRPLLDEVKFRLKERSFETSEVRSKSTSANDLRRFDQAKAEALAFLLRKEVIQPQVPLRLPCYDFVPITSLTLGRRLF